jgi:hypothetical protein
MNYAEGDNNSQNGDNESTGDFCLMNHKRDRDGKNEIFYKEETRLEILDKNETENKSQNNFSQTNFQLIQERRHSLSNSINSNLSNKNKIRKKSENEVFIKERESALTAAKKNNPDIYFKEKLEEIGEKIINSQVLNQAIRGRPRDINIEHLAQEINVENINEINNIINLRKPSESRPNLNSIHLFQGCLDIVCIYIRMII